MVVVLDASALLALWLIEPGAEVVRDAIDAEGALITSVNMAEVLAKMEDLHPGFTSGLREVPKRSDGETQIRSKDKPIRPGSFTVEPFTYLDSVISSSLREKTRSRCLSLGDRSCLALAKRMDLEVLTADQAWHEIADEIAVTVRLIR